MPRDNIEYPIYPLLPIKQLSSITKVPDKNELGSPGPAPVLRFKSSMREFGKNDA
jgi:hypothetical protein